MPNRPLGPSIWWVCCLASLVACQKKAPVIVVEEKPPIEELIDQLAAENGGTVEIPFSELITSVSGNRIIPIDQNVHEERALVEDLSHLVSEVMQDLSRPDSPVRAEKRINEVSRHVEDALLVALSLHPDWECGIPLNAAGKVQRSGYPDLRAFHQPTQRVVYLDPKLFATGSQDSSLRTFYYTPRRATSKVTEDASHLLIGIEHDGQTGQWQMLSFQLVDLSSFRVRLKAEFQASNRDLYGGKGVLFRSNQQRSAEIPQE